MECRAVNVWLLRGDESLEMMYQSGCDPTTAGVGSVQQIEGGIPGRVSDSGEAVLITDADDERLGERSATVTEGGVYTLLVAPIIDKGALVGVVEAVNRLDGKAFDDDDRSR